MWNKYNFDQAEKIKSSPGIYAWYGVYNIGQKDWEGDNDNDTGSIEKVISNMMIKFQPAEIKTTTNMPFEFKWATNIKEIGSLNRSKQLNTLITKEDNSESSTPKNILSNKESRSLVSKILLSTSPVFCSPLYIGKTNNLFRRISEHIAKFEDIQTQKLTKENKNKLFNNGTTFAERAIGAGFYAENLEVYTLDIQEYAKNMGINNMSYDELSKLSELIEWILNRSYRPYLGRK